MNKLNPFSYFNPDFKMDDIKIVYIPSDTKKIIPSIKEYECHYDVSNEVQTYIEQTWTAECTKKTLENEPLVSVRFIDMENGQLEVTPVEYKTWKTTAKKDFYTQFGNKDIPNPLNVQSLIQTKEGQLIFGPRPGKDTLQLPGGMLDTISDRENGHISPAKAAIREFQEEVVPLPVRDIEFLGTSFYAGRVLSTMFMTGKIEMKAEELNPYRIQYAEKIKDYKEFPTAEFIKATPQDIQDALQHKKMQETAMIALLLFGAQNFGKKWFHQNCPTKMLAKHLQKRQRD